MSQDLGLSKGLQALTRTASLQYGSKAPILNLTSREFCFSGIPKTSKGGAGRSLTNGHIWQKSSPFRNKTAMEIDKMFLEKGYIPFGKDPLTGKGSYVNPKNLRQYRIDPYNRGRYREPNHVDVSRPRNYNGPLEKKRFLYFDD